MLNSNDITLTKQDRDTICNQFKMLFLYAIASALVMVLVPIGPISSVVTFSDRIVTLFMAIALLKMGSISKNYRVAAICYFIVSVTSIVNILIGLDLFSSAISYFAPLAAFNELLGHFCITAKENEKLAKKWRLLAFIELSFYFVELFAAMTIILFVGLNADADADVFIALLSLVAAIVMFIFRLIRIVYYKQTIMLFQDGCR